MSVSQSLFYVGIKAVTDIVSIYRIYFFQKSMRNLGFWLYKEETFQLLPKISYPVIHSIKKRTWVLRGRNFQFVLPSCFCLVNFGRFPYSTDFTILTICSRSTNDGKSHKYRGGIALLSHPNVRKDILTQGSWLLEQKTPRRLEVLTVSRKKWGNEMNHLLC